MEMDSIRFDMPQFDKPRYEPKQSAPAPDTAPVAKTKDSQPAPQPGQPGQPAVEITLPGGRKREDVNEATISKAIIDVNKFLQPSNRELRYNIHERTGKFYVKVVDPETDEVIREIPPEKSLDLLANLWELAGILVDKKS